MKTSRKPEPKVEGPRRAQIKTKDPSERPKIYPTVNLRRVQSAVREKVGSVARSAAVERAIAESRNRYRAAALRRLAELAGAEERRKPAVRGPDNATESQAMKQLLSRIADVMEEHGRTWGQGGHLTKQEWVERTAADPWQTASVLQAFGEATGAPIFQEIGYEIAGRPATFGADPHDPYAPRVDPRDPRFQRQQFLDDNQALQALSPQERWEMLQGDPSSTMDVHRAVDQMGQDIDSAGNALAAVTMATPLRGAAGLLAGAGQHAPTIFEVLGTGAMYEVPNERFRPGVGRHWRMVEPSLDMIQARDRVGRLMARREEVLAEGGDEDQVQALNQQLQTAQKEYELSRVAFQEAADKSQYSANPYSVPDRAADRLVEDAWLTVQGLSNNVFNHTVSPTMMPVLTVGLRHIMGDPQADNPHYWRQMSAREKALYRKSADVRRRLLAEARYAKMSDPEIIGQRLMVDYYGFPAGTEVTWDMMKQIRDQAPSVQTIPVMSNSLWDELKIAGSDVAEGVGLLTAGHLARVRMVENLAEVAGNLHGYSQLAEKGGKSAKWARRLAGIGLKAAKALETPSRLTGWLSRSAAGRAIKRRMLSPGATKALGGADEAAALMKATQGRVANALFRAASRGSRAGRAAGRVAGRLGRAMRWMRAGAKFLKPLGVLGLAAAGQQGYDDAWYYGFTDEGQQALEEEMRDQVLSKVEDPGRANLRDWLSIPEAVVWDSGHARAAFARHLNSRLNQDWKESTHAMVQEHLRDKRTAAEVDRAMDDLTQILPGVDELQLYSAAMALAGNRIATRYEDPGFGGTRQVSRREWEISQTPLYKAMSPAAKKRTSDLVRLLGPEAFDSVFYIRDPNSGSMALNRTAWHALLDGTDRPFHNRLDFDGDREIHYQNRYARGELRLRTEQAMRQRQRQEQQQAQQGQAAAQQADVEYQNRMQEFARGEERHKAEREAFNRQQEGRRAAVARQAEQARQLEQKDHEAFLRMIDRHSQQFVGLGPTRLRPAAQPPTPESDAAPRLAGGTGASLYRDRLAALDRQMAEPLAGTGAGSEVELAPRPTGGPSTQLDGLTSSAENPTPGGV